MAEEIVIDGSAIVGWPWKSAALTVIGLVEIVIDGFATVGWPWLAEWRKKLSSMDRPSSFGLGNRRC